MGYVKKSRSCSCYGGSVDCSNCHGSGSITRTEWNGVDTGQYTCSSCGGSGQVRCSRCGGRGTIEEDVWENDSSSSSGGSSSSYTPSSSGGSSRSSGGGNSYDNSSTSYDNSSTSYDNSSASSYDPPFGVMLSIILSVVGAICSAYLSGFLEKIIPVDPDFIEIPAAILVFIICMVICLSEKGWKLVKLAFVCIACIAIGIAGNNAVASDTTTTTPAAEVFMPKPATVTSKTLILYAERSPNSKNLKTLKKGNVIVATGQNASGWTPVKSGDLTGWVLSSSIEVKK